MTSATWFNADVDIPDGKCISLTTTLHIGHLTVSFLDNSVVHLKQS